MTNLGASVGWGLAIAGSLLAGALAAVLLRLPERVAATLTAFGGGILLAAIAFELVPDADAGAGTMLTAGGLIAGTLVYVGADAWLNREPGMRAMRRSGHAAAAGRPMKATRPARRHRPRRGDHRRDLRRRRARVDRARPHDRPGRAGRGSEPGFHFERPRAFVPS